MKNFNYSKKHLLLATMLVIGFSSYAYDFSVGSLNYNIISPEALTVETTENNSASGNVVIPETVAYNGATYTVIQIAAQAFNNATGMTSVSIPSTITTIGNNAFNGCTGITSVSYNATECSTMGASDATAFNGCISVRSVSIGDAVKTIPAYAFKDLTALRSITIPEGVTFIGERAFQGCTSIAQVNFNATECSSMSYAFDGCTTTATLIVSDDVTNIPNDAFNNFTGLTSLTIGKKVSHIGERAFRYCTSLKQVKYNATKCADLGDQANNYSTTVAFRNCDNLSSVVVGDNVTYIPANLFRFVSSLSSLVLGSSLEEIGAYAFGGTNLSIVRFPNSLKIINNGAFSSNKFTSIELNEGLVYLAGFNYCSLLETVNFPSTIETIGDNAFYDCSALKIDIKLPSELKSIGNNAFYQCTSTKSLTLNNNVVSIGDYAFYNCGCISNELILPESLTSIGSSSFYGCRISGKLVIPETMKSIGYGCFNHCVNITELEFNGVSTNWAEYNGDEASYGKGHFYGCTNLSKYKIGNKVTCLVGPIFKNRTNLTSIEIPTSVNHIGNHVFSGCSGLDEIKLHNNIDHIGAYAFANCSRLTEIKLPEKLKYIGASCFSNCSGLTEITIPENVTNIEKYALNGCTHLKSLNFNAIECKAVQTYDYLPPSAKLAHISIGKDVTAIRSYTIYPTSLKVVEWNAKNISYYESYNTKEHIAILGDSVSNFYGAYSPIVISYSEVPPTLSSLKSGATAYVPNAKAYLADANWSKYVICESVTWKGTTDGEKLSYTTNFPYELTLKEYRTKDGVAMSETPCTIGDYQAVFTYMIEDMEFEMVSKFSITPNTSNTIFVDAIKAYRGRQMLIPFKMINNREFTALQCDIHLPSGVTAATDEYGDYVIELSDRKSNTHVVSSELQADGSIRVIVYSSKNYAFSGNEGDMFYMTVNIAPDAEAGDKTLAITNIRLTDAKANDVITNRNESSFGIYDLILGDSNDDLLITMADVVNIVNYVLGDTPEKFVFVASDMNADGDITMADVVLVVNAVLNGGVSQPKGCKSAIVPMAETPNSITLQDLALIPGETATLLVDMTNDVDITAFQFDIKLPEGISIPVDEYGDPLISLTSRATNTHQIVSAYQEDGSLRVAAYSSKSRPFKGNSGTLVEITLEAASTLEDGTYNIDMSTVYIIKPDGTQLDIDDFTHSIEINSSGVENIGINGVEEVARYDIHGRLLSEPTKGINIVKYSDGTTRKEILK